MSLHPLSLHCLNLKCFIFPFLCQKQIRHTFGGMVLLRSQDRINQTASMNWIKALHEILTCFYSKIYFLMKFNFIVIAESWFSSLLFKLDPMSLTWFAFSFFFGEKILEKFPKEQICLTRCLHKHLQSTLEYWSVQHF